VVGGFYRNHKGGNMKRITAVLLVGAVGFSGCTSTEPRQMIASNTPLFNNNYKILGPASGESCATHLFGFINMGGTNRLQAAIDDALEKSKGDALIEVTSDVKETYILVITRSCVMVNGLAIKK
jgi:hypothetical protein